MMQTTSTQNTLPAAKTDSSPAVSTEIKIQNKIDPKILQQAGSVQFLRKPPRQFHSPHFAQQNFAKTDVNAYFLDIDEVGEYPNNSFLGKQYDRTSFRYSRRSDWKYPQALKNQDESAQIVGILPPPETFIQAIIVHIIDVLNGHRPAKHLRTWMSFQAYQALVRRTQLGLEIYHGAARCAAPRVRKIRIFQPTPRVVEAALVIFDGRRIRAAAIRLEAQKGRWIIVEIEVI